MEWLGRRYDVLTTLWVRRTQRWWPSTIRLWVVAYTQLNYSTKPMLAADKLQ